MQVQKHSLGQPRGGAVDRNRPPGQNLPTTKARSHCCRGESLSHLEHAVVHGEGYRGLASPGNEHDATRPRITSSQQRRAVS